jgi:ABC-type sugar transport system ATPase subunit
LTYGLELTDISKRYDTAEVLKGISLAVESGSLLVLLGPSGSGKSTLLRIIAGLIPPDRGRVTIAGENVTEVSPADRGVAMVFQSYALFPHLSVYDNLAFGLQARNVPKSVIDKKVRGVAKKLRLIDLLNRYPREASGGERQRVALGRAMLREPAVFLMDEPLSNLDTQLRHQMRTQILKVHAELSSTMVYVTHDQQEALSMGDLVGVLNEGRLEQIGTAREIYERPATLFVARFVGDPMMNTLPIGKISATHLTWKGHDTPLASKNKNVWEQAAGKRLLLGIRAENISIEGSRWATGVKPDNTIPATVQRVELAGDQQFVTLEVEDTRLVTRCEPELPIKSGERVEVWFDATRQHIFDADSGRTLTGENV